jgi:shikimate kinase
VALVGLRGAGKSAVGRLLAERLGSAFHDLDEALLAEAPGGARDAGEVLRRLGEARFRELETRALRACLARAGDLVLATGGGVVERAENRDLLRRRCRCLWLEADPRTLLTRAARDATDRPPLTDLDPVAELALLAQRREPLYRELAERAFETSGRSLAEVVEHLLAHLRP